MNQTYLTPGMKQMSQLYSGIKRRRSLIKLPSMQTRGYPISHEDAIRIMTKAGVTDYFIPSFWKNSLVYKYFILTFWNI